MTEPDPAFVRHLNELAHDVLPPEAVVATVRAGYRKRLRRRRALATGSVVAVVLLLAGATTVLATRPTQVSHAVNPSTLSSTMHSSSETSQNSAATTNASSSPQRAPLTTSIRSLVPPFTTPSDERVLVTATPAFGARDVSPNSPVKVSVSAGSITQLTMGGDGGRRVAGHLSADRRTWTNSEKLDYDMVYTFTGRVTSTNGTTTGISGEISTVKPVGTEKAAIQIPDGSIVGVGASIIVTFSGVIRNRAAAEAALKVTTSAGSKLQGNWGWIPDDQIQGDGPLQSQVHWRPTASPVSGKTPYWPAFTKVHVQADLKGVDYGGGQWGSADFSSDFTVGRSQIVIADASTFHLVVTVNGEVTKSYAVAYGIESVPGRATVNGIHIVTEKYPTFALCNPDFPYCNAQEKWSVRINNNGEFIHENLKAKSSFGVGVVSHGCINMGEPDAQDYYDSAIYGDPVEVSNTGGPAMSDQDSLYDWIYSPGGWKALSAL